MIPSESLERRFGIEAASRLTRLLAPYPGGSDGFAPAPMDRCRGAMAGMLFGEALPAILQAGNPGRTPNTQLGLLAAAALMEDPQAHPKLFAGSLLSADASGAGAATNCAQAALRNGQAWWSAGTANSAGAAAAARAPVFGLLYSGDPSRAAYEAALCALVTHRHGAAIAGAAAVGAAVALAAQGDEPLGREWLEAVADICGQYRQEAVYGQTVASGIRAAAGSLEDFLRRPERAFEPSALCTQAVPAALLAAASAPSPQDLAPSGRGYAVLGALASLHEASRAIAGACIGARGGRDAWTALANENGRLPGNWVRTPGLAGVLALADRIAGQGPRHPDREPPAAENDHDGAAVHISFLIDRSGSMAGMEEDVVSGFNEFVERQREHPGACSLTLVMFDDADPCEVVYDDVPIGSIPAMAAERFQPRGATPLLDAMGGLIRSAEERCRRLGRGAADEDQVVVVFTDGMENSSVRWNRRKLFELIKARRAAGWSFVFLGANQDSYHEAGSLGIDAGSIQDYHGDRHGVRAAFESVNRAMGEYRRVGQAERSHRRSAFFDGRKEAEEDHRNRR